MEKRGPFSFTLGDGSTILLTVEFDIIKLAQRLSGRAKRSRHGKATALNGAVIVRVAGRPGA